MDVIILAGGLGTRLRSEVSAVPKVMAPLHGKPFLSFLMSRLILSGADRFILCTGYLGEKIVSYYGNSFMGIPVVYSREEQPLGTGGALKKALALCGGRTAVALNGDTYADTDLSAMFAFHNINNARITVAVREIADVSASGCVRCGKDGKLVSFSEKGCSGSGMVNAGVYVLSPDVFDGIKEESFSFEAFIQSSVDGVFCFLFDGDFIDIGLPESYHRAINELPRPVCFVDRDGTLNVEKNHLFLPSELELVPGTVQAITRLNALGIPVAVVSNQAGIAKGLFTPDDTRALNAELQRLLEAKGAHIDLFVFCPHHPQGTVEQYSRECSCRKPSPGMLFEAKRQLEEKGTAVDMPRSMMVGDTEKDILAGKAAAVGECVLVRSGHAIMNKTAADRVENSLWDYVNSKYPMQY